MILAAHQPLYLPALSFFYKAALADVFVLGDDVQYSTHSVINRTRIKTAVGPRWLTVPVLTKGRGLQKINEVRIDPTQDWARRHWKTLEVNYKRSPYFDDLADSLAEIYHHAWERLVEVNIAFMEWCFHRLEIHPKVLRSSELGIEETGHWRLIRLLEKSGCDVYLSGEEAKSWLDEKLFQERGLEVRFANFRHPTYHQLSDDFIPEMSVLDLLFNEGERSREILRGGG